MKKIFFVVCFLLTSFSFTLAEVGSDTSDTFYISINGKNVPARIKDIYVITPTRLTTSKTEIASSITVITSEEIQDKKASNILEVLKDVPGLDVVQSGGYGQNSAVFIRGAKSEHTLVMIDGIEMNDPIDTGRGYNFSNITLDNIEQIEIIRGPQSVLYGSDAMAGVINIITKKGSGKPQVSLMAEAGSFKTYMENLELSGGSGKMNYSLSVSQINTEGISSASSKYGNTEKDGYQNTSFSTRLEFLPKEKFNMDFILKYLNSKTELDARDSLMRFVDDPNYITKNRQIFLSTHFGLPSLLKERKQDLQLSFSKHNWDSDNDKDIDHPDDFSTGAWKGQIWKINWQHTIIPGKSNNILAGLEYEEEKGSSDYYQEGAGWSITDNVPEEKTQTKGYYLQDQINIQNRFFTTLGVRLDDHKTFGSHATYRIAPAYVFEQTNTKIKASYGTGFKSPSLYQLYSFNGNIDLKPEENKSWDAGIEQYLFDKNVMFDLGYFNNDFSNLIDWVMIDPVAFTGKYKNIADAKTEGVELNASFRLTDNLVVNGNGTRMFKIKDETTDEDLIRRAKNKYSLNTDYKFSSKGDINIELIYVGERDDKNYSTMPETRVRLNSYSFVNASVSYNIRENLQIFAKANNIFDKDYEEVYGYGTPGASYYFGIKSDF